MDTQLLSRLRAGDERAFETLVEGHHAAMVRVAELYVPGRAVAEEVAQEAWLGVLEGLGRFEGRSSLRTWIFRILTNRARTRGERERRTVPLSALHDPDREGGEAPVDEESFFSRDGGGQAGMWSQPPRSPEGEVLGREARGRILSAIDQLPPAQRTVVTLRDVEGWDSQSVREVLEVTAENQRILLHRGRSKVRAAFERYLDEGGKTR